MHVTYNSRGADTSLVESYASVTASSTPGSKRLLLILLSACSNDQNGDIWHIKKKNPLTKDVEWVGLGGHSGSSPQP